MAHWDADVGKLSSISTIWHETLPSRSKQAVRAAYLLPRKILTFCFSVCLGGCLDARIPSHGLLLRGRMCGILNIIFSKGFSWNFEDLAIMYDADVIFYRRNKLREKDLFDFWRDRVNLEMSSSFLFSKCDVPDVITYNCQACRHMILNILVL